MEPAAYAKIRNNPKFAELVTRRGALARNLTIAMLVIYFGFILLVAFDKELLAKNIGPGVTSLGVPLGVAVIVFTIILTWIYVRRANSEFDDTNEALIKEATK